MTKNHRPFREYVTVRLPNNNAQFRKDLELKICELAGTMYLTLCSDDEHIDEQEVYYTFGVLEASH